MAENKSFYAFEKDPFDEFVELGKRKRHTKKNQENMDVVLIW